jgi:hypothetical protein
MQDKAKIISNLLLYFSCAITKVNNKTFMLTTVQFVMTAQFLASSKI